MKLRSGTPEMVGMSRERVERVTRLAEGWVEEGIHPALVVLAARKGVIFLYEAFGRLGSEKDSPALERESIFPLVSITKPITATTAMILAEEGLLGLNRPVADYVPEFSGEGREKILVRQLLTHTSGLRWQELLALLNEDGLGLKEDKFSHWWSENLDQYFQYLYRMPLWTEPDSVMTYSNINYDLLGEVVGRVSGVGLADFANERVFTPLGMKGSFFSIPEDARDRIIMRPKSAVYYDLTTKVSGASLGSVGAFSTAYDMAIFGQMFLNRGTYDGARILSKASVDAMTRDQIPGKRAVFGEQVFPDAEWGLGWGVHHTKKAWGWDELQQSQTSFSHSGSGGVIIKVDPAYEMVMVFFSVYLNLLENGRPNGNTDLFVNALMASIEEL